MFTKMMESWIIKKLTDLSLLPHNPKEMFNHDTQWKIIAKLYLKKQDRIYFQPDNSTIFSKYLMLVIYPNPNSLININHSRLHLWICLYNYNEGHYHTLHNTRWCFENAIMATQFNYINSCHNGVYARCNSD